MSDNTAILAGMKDEYMAYAGPDELHIFVNPDADLDDEFNAYDADECEFITVNGWMCTFKLIASHDQ